MSRVRRISFMASAISVLCFGWSGARAESPSVAEFYGGHQLNVIVGYSAGGGFDVYARLLAQRISEYIPGHPRVVVENMPGAGGLKAALYLLNSAPRDGSYIATTGRSVFFAPILSDAKFDGRAFNWLGSITDDVGVCLATSSSPVQSWNDLLHKTFVAGGIGPEDDLDTNSNALKHIFNAKIKLVTGYPGTNDIKAAMARGELQGECGLSSSSMTSSFATELKDKSVKVFLQVSLKKSSRLPDVPYVGQFATASQKKVLQPILEPQKMSRPFAAPPNVPADRLAALQRAFDETMKDKGFLAQAARAHLPVNPMNAMDVKRLVRSIYALPKAITDQSARAISDDSD